MKDKEIILLIDSPNLVEYRTNIEGWTGPDNLYYGKGPEGEQRARYANCTHKKCECGHVYKKNAYCDVCSTRKDKEKFEALEEIEWDGESMMTERYGEQFFSDMDDVLEYCDDNEIEIEDLQLMHCELKTNVSQINIDELNEEATDQDGNGVSHYYPEIAKKVDELNELIKNTTPKLWFQTNKRIKLP